MSATLYAAEGDVRLSPVNASEDGSAEYGRLEVFFRGGWGTVCDSIGVRGVPGGTGLKGPRFTAGSAEVACRRLGFPQAFQTQAPVTTRNTAAPRFNKVPHMD